ncbi:MAG: hypothetical protein LH470_04190 [Lysobacter sp.]|nr:hypothetical protein [Lysobacter sp.]
MTRLTLPFIVTGALALVAYWFVLSLRYGWYLQPEAAAFLQWVTIGTVLCIMALWFWFPSRLLTAAIGAAGFTLPPLVMGAIFVEIDAAFAPWAVASLSLIVLASHLRLRGLGINRVSSSQP